MDQTASFLQFYAKALTPNLAVFGFGFWEAIMVKNMPVRKEALISSLDFGIASGERE